MLIFSVASSVLSRTLKKTSSILHMHFPRKNLKSFPFFNIGPFVSGRTQAFICPLAHRETKAQGV